MVPRINLPDSGELPRITLPPYGPNLATMDGFDRDPDALWQACNQWLKRVQHPPTEPLEWDWHFHQLTEALRMWASLQGLGNGLVLIDAIVDGGRKTFVR